MVSRWISSDPALEKYLPSGNKDKDNNLPGLGGVFRPVNIDLYHYAGNSPVMFIDPNGQEDVVAGSFTNLDFGIDHLRNAFSNVREGTAKSLVRAQQQFNSFQAECSVSVLGAYYGAVAVGAVKNYLAAKLFGAGYATLYSKYALEATKNASSNRLVLGKFSRNGLSYDRIAEKMEATYFHLKNWNQVMKKVGESNMWKINKEFLVQQISKGKKIFLSHDPSKATGYFKREVDFLIEKGYKFVENGKMWKAIKK